MLTAIGNSEEEGEVGRRRRIRRTIEAAAAGLSRSRTTGYNKWLITNLGTVSRKEQKYSSFCGSSKRWTMMFSHLLDLTVLNSWILLSSCGAKYTNRDYRLLLVRKLIEEAEKTQNHHNPRLVVRPSVGTKMFCDSRVAITNTGEQNHPHKCTAV